MKLFFKLTIFFLFAWVEIGFCPPFLPQPFNFSQGFSDISFSADPELVDSYKSKVVKDVFDKLKMVKGDFSSSKPYLRFVVKNVVNNKHSGVASAFPNTGLIYLEEKGYDLCVGFGKDSLNALAILLSHELIHYYEKHSWEEHFASTVSDPNLGNEIADNYEKDEIQADYLGGFLAYQAGFKTFGIMPKFLEVVYKEYKITDENTKGRYPPLEKRKEISTQSEKKLKELIDLFETANFLLVLEEYEDALVYYTKILEDFQSREMYNNLGVINILTALNYFKKDKSFFKFPVELDVNSRLSLSTKGSNPKEIREEKLTAAIEQFQKAAQMDALYPIAHLNEACARALMGISQQENSDSEWEEAAFIAKKALRLSKNNPEFSATESDAQVLLGIISGLCSETEEAEAFFQKALEKDPENLFAKKNKEILKGGDLTKMEKLTDPASLPAELQEKIEGKRISELEIDTTFLTKILKWDENWKMTLYLQRKSTSGIFCNETKKNTDGREKTLYSTFQVANRDYSGKSQMGVGIGDSLVKVIQAYHQPSAEVRLGDGYFLRYNLSKTGGLIFQIQNNRVKQWSAFNQIRI